LRFSGDPLLADFAAPFPDLLTQAGGDLEASFAQVARLMGRGRRAAFIRFTIGPAGGGAAAEAGVDTVRRFHLGVTTQACTVIADDVGRADLEILTTAEIWSAIAAGRLSPLAAFGAGKLRVRGDIGLARQMARRLRGQRAHETP
jgi:SCP-2 sterol transfer family protein